MNFSAVKGLTISAPVTIVPQTSDDYVECIDAKWDAVIDDSTYNVVVDGVSYQCTPWQSIYGEFCLGDSRLTKIWDDEAGEEVSDMTHPEDVPFYANTYREIFGDLVNETVMDYWYFYYPDSNSHTIEIQAMNQANVTQIADASGRVIWRLKGDEPETTGAVVLQAEKITSNTFAGGTTYTAEEFILLDIYPKTNGTVSVTYGGLTKTITDTSGAAEPNAQQVFFGTFNGVSDSVATPTSGELTIEGDYYAYAVGQYITSSKNLSASCPCVIGVVKFGDVTVIPYGGFQACDKITSLSIPKTVTSIGDYSFFGCGGLVNVIVLSVTPPSLGGGAAFDNTTCTIIVPKGCGASYKAAQYWNEYADRIVEAS